MVTKDYSEYIGKKFNKLTILEIFRVKEKNQNRVKAKCICDCDRTTIADLYKVLSGHTTSCGCYKNRKVRETKEDLSGHRFGRLLVVKRVQNKDNRVMYLCLCNCGNYCTVDSASLKRGATQSCGCLHKEVSSIKNSKHGKRKTRLYKIWDGMKQRCYNTNDKGYKNYGGRGITVCDEWKNDFMNFYDWAMQNGYDESAPRGQCTIDRINNDGNYEPSNCRWVDMKVQLNNMTSNRMITYNGETHNMKERSKINKIKYEVLKYRLNIGWTMEKIIATFG